MKKFNTVCIIDDDDIYKFTITKTIESTGLVNKIIDFGDGEEALDYLLETAADTTELPDIILLDVNMPVMDGWDFLEVYHEKKGELNKNIIIFMISSSIDERDVDRAKQISELTDYIVKPINRDKVMHIFEAAKGEEKGKDSV